MKSLVILGSTGSIGRQTLEIVRSFASELKVVGLAAGNNVPLLIEQIEEMKERAFGRIVNISSIAAKYGSSSSSMHYGCSKLALEGISKTLAREGAKDNVLVNTVRPGVIDTEFHKKFPKNMEKRISMIPAQRIGKPSEVADIVYYLGSEANTFITNETITVAGGE